MQVLTQKSTTALYRTNPRAGGGPFASEAVERLAEGGCGVPVVAGMPMDGAVCDADFVQLQAAYRPTGGMAHGDELAARLNAGDNGGYSRLARWIVGRQLFSVSWNEHFWLPMFQFDTADLSPHRRLRPVLDELMDVMDGRDLATWFAQPNEALQGFSPVAMWASHWLDVFHAARLQRFAAKG